jgi:hypothetical protein
LFGVSENPDRFPEHEREKEQQARSGEVTKQKETENLPLVAQISKVMNPFTRALAPSRPFYRETNGLLHSENTLELEEYP